MISLNAREEMEKTLKRIIGNAIIDNVALGEQAEIFENALLKVDASATVDFERSKTILYNKDLHTKRFSLTTSYQFYVEFQGTPCIVCLEQEKVGALNAEYDSQYRNAHIDYVQIDCVRKD